MVKSSCVQPQATNSSCFTPDNHCSSHACCYLTSYTVYGRMNHPPLAHASKPSPLNPGARPATSEGPASYTQVSLAVPLHDRQRLGHVLLPFCCCCCAHSRAPARLHTASVPPSDPLHRTWSWPVSTAQYTAKPTQALHQSLLTHVRLLLMQLSAAQLQSLLLG